VHAVSTRQACRALGNDVGLTVRAVVGTADGANVGDRVGGGGCGEGSLQLVLRPRGWP
jgi:hypothetical protein